MSFYRRSPSTQCRETMRTLVPDKRKLVTRRHGQQSRSANMVAQLIPPYVRSISHHAQISGCGKRCATSRHEDVG